MPKLSQFSAPAGLRGPKPAEWSRTVQRMFAGSMSTERPQFYDPTKTNTPPGAARPMISWAAFPAALRGGTQLDRWRRADGDRSVQDEYCEWTVERNSARKITRVTFTTEVPEYWEHLFHAAPEQLVRLYRKLVDARVELAHLTGPDNGYLRENRWNRSGAPGRLAHLIQPSNTLGAAIDLVAVATVPRTRNGELVTTKQALARCAGMGNPLRNSDPQIGFAVNVAAREGNDITLADPLGLYLGRPLTAGMATPDGADAARFWKIERGDAEHALRARFEVPKSRGYVVGDIEILGRPIEFGGQVAERVPVWVNAVVKNANRSATPRPCGA
jgi:hypothetical protein